LRATIKYYYGHTHYRVENIGERNSTRNAFDVFIRPLVWDLLKLEDGVPTVDMSKNVGQRTFVLQCILMWTVHNFHAYELVSRQQAKGYKGCPICMEEMDAEHFGCLYKIVYMGHTYYLQQGYHWRHARRVFNGQQEFCPPLRWQTCEEILEKGESKHKFFHDKDLCSENNNDPGIQ
jgi:hypothetical protein